MSRKIEKRKTAVFCLEPDGFSIHTFELFLKLSKSDYDKLKDKLYREYPGTYQTKHDVEDQEDKKKNESKYIVHNCKCEKFAKHGVRIRLIACRCYCREDSFCMGSGYYLKMVINPRKLIEPADKYRYLGILPPNEESVNQVTKAFKELFHKTIFKKNMDDYKVSRVDFCTNIRCDSSKLFRELVRVLRKLPTPTHYKRMIYSCDDRKKANKYNKHYLRYVCGTHELVIYDKTFQMTENDLIVGYEHLPEGVLRFEMHCKRPYIRNLEKELAGKADGTEKRKQKKSKGGTDGKNSEFSKPSYLLWELIQRSEEELTKKFTACFPEMQYLHPDDIREKIKASSYKKKTKKRMCELVELLSRVQSVDKALSKMEKNGYDVSDLLDRFKKLGISPVPLRMNSRAHHLPSLAELLRTAAAGEKVEVKYTIVKYK